MNATSIKSGADALANLPDPGPHVGRESSPFSSGPEVRIEALFAQLWTYGRDSWLPHGSAKDGNAADQPVWLTEKDENPNGAQFLFLTDGAAAERVAEFERCFDIFDGNDPAAVEAARVRWKDYAAAGFALAYWQQTASGGWES